MKRVPLYSALLISIVLLSSSHLRSISAAKRRRGETTARVKTTTPQLSWEEKYNQLKGLYKKREDLLKSLMEKKFGTKKTQKLLEEANATIPEIASPEIAESGASASDISQLMILLGQKLPGKKLGKASTYKKQVNQVAFILGTIQDPSAIENIKHTIMTYYQQASDKVTDKRREALHNLENAMIKLTLLDVTTFYSKYIAQVNNILKNKPDETSVHLLAQMIEKLPDEQLNQIGKFRIFQFIKEAQKNSKLALMPATQKLIKLAQGKGIMPK